MNIAIVDDEKVELETAEVFLRHYIKKFYPEREAEIHIEIFRAADEFLQVFSAELYQLVVLGARMEDVANFVRARGDNVPILFFELNGNFGGGIL